MNVREIFNNIIKPNVGHIVTIKKAKEEWNGKKFITSDLVGKLKEYELYTNGDGSISIWFNVNDHSYDVTNKDFYFENK